MIPLGPVVARARVRAERQSVWNYLADQGLRAAWWPEVNLDAVLGGDVVERWVDGEGEHAMSRDASGTVDVYVDGHALGFRWSDAGDTASTAVLFTLRAQGVDTGVTVTETGFDALPMAAERAAASTEGWQSLLADLVAAVDAGAGEASGVTGAAEAAVGAGAGAAAVAEANAGAGSAPASIVDDAFAQTEIDSASDGVRENDTVEVGAVAHEVAEVSPVEGAADSAEVETAEAETAEADAVNAEAESDVVQPETAEAEADADAVADEADEVDAGESDEAADGAAATEAIETDAVDLDDAATVAIDMVKTDADADLATAPPASAEPIADVNGDYEEDLVPLVLPGPPSGDGEAEGEDTESFTGDPDFDALIRGDSIE